MDKENLLDQPSTTQILGKTLLHFLNKPQVPPRLDIDSLEEHKAWSQCCVLAMGMVKGDVTLSSDENKSPPQMEKLKQEAIKKELKRQAGEK